jgi:hypothetical protein
METINQLQSRGYTIRANRYAQKNLGNGWYVGVDLVKHKVDAGHITQLKPREEHMCYDWETTNHIGFSIPGVKVVKAYVRNEEAHTAPEHMVIGWAELLEHRLK